MMSPLTRTARLFLAAGLAFAPAVLALRPTQAQTSQNFRSVSGEVIDKGGAAVKGAVVHLKDTKSMSQRTYITADDGHYKFAQLSTATDYEIWAERNGSKSDNKSISSFDTKHDDTINLKMP